MHHLLSQPVPFIAHSNKTAVRAETAGRMATGTTMAAVVSISPGDAEAAAVGAADKHTRHLVLTALPWAHPCGCRPSQLS